MPEDINKVNSELDALIQKLEQVGAALESFEAGNQYTSGLKETIDSLVQSLNQLKSGDIQNSLDKINASLKAISATDFEKVGIAPFATKIRELQADLNLLVKSYKELNSTQTAGAVESPLGEKATANLNNLTDSIQKARDALRGLLSETAKGGTPTESGLNKAVDRLLGGNVPESGRIRVGGGARASLGKVRDDLAAINQQLKELNQLTAKPVDIQERVFGAGAGERADKAREEMNRQLAGNQQILANANEAKRIQKVQEAYDNLKKSFGEKLGPQVQEEVSKVAQTIEKMGLTFDSIKTTPLKDLEGGFQNFVVTLSSGSDPVKKFTLYVAELEKVLNAVDFKKLNQPVKLTVAEQFEKLTQTLGPKAVGPIKKEIEEFQKAFADIGLNLKFDTIDVSPLRKLETGFNSFTVTVKDGSQGIQQFTMYVNELGEAMNKLAYDEARAKANQFTPQGLEASLGKFRSERATRLAQQHGFGIEQLTNVRTQEPSGVSILNYQEVDKSTGAMKELEITVDRFGNVLSRTNKRLLGFTDAIVRNTAEVLRWSIGVGLVYGSIYKLQALFSTAIDNEAKLADITVVLGDAQKDVNTIFDAAASVARETGQSINGVLESYTSAYRAVGAVSDPVKRTAAATKLLTDATTLDKLSSLDAAEAIDVLSGSLRQIYGNIDDVSKSFDHGTDLLDKWVAVTKTANVDLATLATAFSVTSESALNAGVSVDQLNAIIASLSEKIGGLGGKETGNAVRALIGGVYQTQAAGALAQYGIAVTDVEGKMRPFLEISKDIYNLYKGGLIDTSQLNKIGYVLGGGVRRGQQYVAFLSDLGRIQEIASVSTNAHGDAEEALARKIDVTQTSITNLGNAFQQLAQTMGTSGGVLDLANGLLKTFTFMVDVVNELSKLLGHLAVPAAVLAITKIGFAGPVGANRQLYAQAGIGGFVERLVTSLVGTLRPALTQQAQYRNAPPSQAQLIGKQYGGVARDYGLSFLLGATPALGRAGAGQWGAAGADLAGAAIGAFVAKGNVMGGIIGSAIAEFFLSRTLDFKPQFENLFKDIFPKPEETGKGTSKQSIQEQQKAIFDEIYKQLGSGSETIGKFFSNTVADLYNFVNDLTGGKNATVTREQFALAGATPEQITQIQKLRQAQPVTTEEVNIQASQIAQTQNKLILSEAEGGYKDFLAGLVKDTRAALSQKFIAGEVKPTEYLNQTEGLQGLASTVTKYFAAFGKEYDDVNKNISGAKAVFSDFADFVVNGTQEDIDYINKFASEIFDLTAKLQKANEEGRDFIDINGEAIPRQTVESIIAEDAKAAAQALEAMRKQQVLNQTTLPTTISVDAFTKDFQKIISRARQLEDIYKQALTPDERAKYEAEQAGSDALVEMWDNINKQAYQRIQGGPAQNFITQAFQDLVKQGNIQQAGKGLGFQAFDVTSQQFQAIQPKYESLLNRLQAKGYTPDRETQIAIFKDGIIEPMTKDWKVVQYLLQQILDVNQKQLDGLYNLPSGANFYVPFQTLDLAYNAGVNAASGGGGIGALDSSAADAARKVDEFGGAIANAVAQMTGKGLGGEYGTAATKVPTTAYRYTGRGLGGEFGATDPLRSLADSADKLSKTIPNTLQKGTVPGQPGFDWRVNPKATSPLNVEDLSAAFSAAITPEKLSTQLNMNITSSTQLVVDGAVLAQVVKNYIWADLIRYAGTGGTVGTNVAL